MDSVKLKISIKDWLFILVIAAFFGFFISLFFYFLNKDLQGIDTILFSIISAIVISFFAFVFITISNEYILPKVSEKFWYAISFLFSFLSGFLGFFTSFKIFEQSSFAILELISNHIITICLILGCLTLLIGLILHQFISMKYKNEFIQNQILESKIKALENELNPHFLFNALNSISELIYIDKQKAEKATLDLSVFLRSAIKTSSLVSIDEELNMVKNYLEIENIRFDGNIKLHKTILEEEKEKLIPKFSIQLLVENAIKHGFENKELNVYIKVDKRNIEVSNDGRKSSSISYGTGLSNLENRLKLLDVGVLDYKIDDEKVCFFIKF